MGRDAMPERFPNAADAAIEQYVGLLLSAVGAKARTEAVRASA
jgi:hypothetical protein